MYRGSEIDVVPGLTAGPTLEKALETLAGHLEPGGERPGVDAYSAYARTLFDAFDHRLAYIGDVPDTGPSSHTTHLNVAVTFSLPPFFFSLSLLFSLLCSPPSHWTISFSVTYN